MKNHRIAQEVKDEVINRIKNDGIPVAQVAKDHGIHETTVYGWLGAKVDGAPNVLEIAKLRRENDELLRLVGLMTLKLSAL